jgi:hypothetical protein
MKKLLFASIILFVSFCLATPALSQNMFYKTESVSIYDLDEEGKATHDETNLVDAIISMNEKESKFSIDFPEHKVFYFIR